MKKYALRLLTLLILSQTCVLVAAPQEFMKKEYTLEDYNDEFGNDDYVIED